MNRNNRMKKRYPSPLQANYALIILLLAYILSFIDRNILAVLVGPIRDDFSISDFQFSLLHGTAFTVFYIFLGLPIGWLADRVSRKWIIVVGVFFWSLMTALCGMANSFLILFLVRIGVGVGEAALSPPAYSLFSDYFSPRRLRWATAIFSMGITIGSGLSYKIGSWAYQYLGEFDFAAWPILAAMNAWQLTFVMVGLPGVLVVLLGWLMKEPPRVVAEQKQDASQFIPINEVFAYFRCHWQAYGALAFGVCMMSIIGYGTLGWFPEFLIRSYGMSRAQAGSELGNIFLIAGTAGSLAGAVFATLLQRRGYKDANMRMVMLAAALLVIPASIAPLMPKAEHAIYISWLVIFIHYTHFGVAMAALQLITPSRMRAQTSALMLFLTNLFGLALGGTIVALFTDFIFADDQALRYSLSVVAAIAYPLAAIVIGLGLKYYRAALLSD